MTVERKSVIPEPYQTIVRRELRKIPTWKLQEAYGKLKAGEATGIELVERDRAYAIGAIEEVLWERGKLSTQGSSPGAALVVTAGIGTLSLALGIMALWRSSPLGQRLYYHDGQYLVSVRYPGQWNDIRDFVQPSNPEVLAVYSQIGPDIWQCLDFVCRYVTYKRELGEMWQFPSETLARGEGDCEDSTFLFVSLAQNFAPNVWAILGDYQGFGHAWGAQNGFIYETTYTLARPVPDPQDYCPYVYFSDQEVVELWPGALGDIFELRRDEKLKLGLMAKALESVA